MLSTKTSTEQKQDQTLKQANMNTKCQAANNTARNASQRLSKRFSTVLYLTMFASRQL